MSTDGAGFLVLTRPRNKRLQNNHSVLLSSLWAELADTPEVLKTSGVYSKDFSIAEGTKESALYSSVT